MTIVSGADPILYLQAYGKIRPTPAVHSRSAKGGYAAHSGRSRPAMRTNTFGQLPPSLTGNQPTAVFSVSGHPDSAAPLDSHDDRGVGGLAGKPDLLDQMRGNDPLDHAFPLIAWL